MDYRPGHGHHVSHAPPARHLQPSDCAVVSLIAAAEGNDSIKPSNDLEGIPPRPRFF